jgi:hypothetical protein
MWRVLMLVGFLLVGCDSSEGDARALLTKGQQSLLAGSYIEALETFEDIAKRYPRAAAATEAIREIGPLRKAKISVIAACYAYRDDTGQELKHREDLMVKSRMVDRWRGPYLSPDEDRMFGAWIARTGCRD